MLEKTVDVVFSYCFGVLDVFCAFFERTHAVVGLGIPMLFVILVHAYLPAWVAAAIAVFVLAPAAAAMGIMLVEGLLLTRRR